MKKTFSIISMLIALILKVLPYGIAMTFADGPNNRFTLHFSYFSFTPIGYGNWLPMIVAVFSIAVLVLLLVGNKINTEKSVKICLAVCLVASSLSWLMFNTISIIGIIVAILHGTTLILQMLSPENYHSKID